MQVMLEVSNTIPDFYVSALAHCPPDAKLPLFTIPVLAEASGPTMLAILEEEIRSVGDNPSRTISQMIAQAMQLCLRSGPSDVLP